MRPPALAWSARSRHLLIVALAIVVVFHGGLLAAGSFRGTYDAYVHIFLADHYQRDWFSSWEPRWYTGFPVTSYPPGGHQLVALAGRVLGLEWGFALVQLVALVGITIGVFRFARLWVHDDAAGWAAVLAASSSSIAEAVHTFGQLPTTLSLAFLLNAAPFARSWIEHGTVRSLVAALACTAATTACHHVTTLFGSVFFVTPVIVRSLLDASRAGDRSHPVRVTAATGISLALRRLRRVAPTAGRAGAYAVATLCSLVVVVLPYWLWTASDPISQITIPHASRSDFLEDRAAGLVFWVVPWGALLLLAPLAVVRGLLSRAWPLAASVGLLALLGTGGTTPIPRVLLGGAYEILTLDRFTYWATIAILPLAGWVLASLTAGRLDVGLRANLGSAMSGAIRVGLAGVFAAMAIFAANLGQFRTFQPDPIEMDPIVSFLAKDDHDRWRYLTLGFGDQMAWLSAQTTALTVDGNYHSARRLPELTTTSVERLEGAKFRGVAGLGSLQQFLALPERYHLKYVFSNDDFYDPLLAFSGWNRLERLENGVVVWERADVPPMPAGVVAHEIPRWQRALWGTLPLTAVVAAALVLATSVVGAPMPGPFVRLARGVGAELRRRRVWSWFVRLGVRIDRRTASIVGPPPRRLPRAIVRRRDVVQRSLLHVSARRRRIQVGAALLVIGALVVVGGSGGGTEGPERVVVGYYDDLDFRRHDDAWAALDPTTRPSLEQYLLDLSVTNGLVASYGKLETIRTDLVSVDGDRAVVVAELVHLTAVERHHERVVHELVHDGDRWFVVAEPRELGAPPAELVRRSGVEVVSLGRREVTDDATASADVLDRPELSVREALAVRVDDEWYVLGSVTNDDVDPADLTVTAVLLDADGRELARYNATRHTVHDVLPGETVPFRVGFEGVAGAETLADPTAGDFDADASTPVGFDPDGVASVQLAVKAVVGGGSLGRPLELLGVRARDDDDAVEVSGSLRNGGVDEVTVPRLVVAVRDRLGALLWVDAALVDEAIRPQREAGLRLAFDVPLTSASLPVDVSVNGLPEELVAPGPPAGFEADGRFVQIVADSFTRSTR